MFLLDECHEHLSLVINMKCTAVLRKALLLSRCLHQFIQYAYVCKYVNRCGCAHALRGVSYQAQDSAVPPHPPPPLKKRGGCEIA